MRPLGAQARGVLGSLRSGHGGARALAVGDSRALVRVLFLSSAVRLNVLSFLNSPRTLDELATRTATTRRDRLEAWLAVGVALR